MRLRFVAGTVIVLVPHVIRAQQLVGTVRDSASRQPVAGAVIQLLNASGTVLGRNLTNGRGDYRVVLSADMRRVRVMRIGFRPREASIPSAPAGTPEVRLDISMVALPTFLEPVQIVENLHCPRRSDHAAALGLLEQARAGLLTTIVAREANPPKLVRLTFERVMDGTTDRIASQRVRMDSTDVGKRSFKAVRSGADFVEKGFTFDSAGGQVFLAPDAETLLDEGFAAGYCFRIADRDRARPNQVGLSFAPADRKRDRVDVDGTLWIDTTARALHDIDVQYVGLDRRVEALHPGARISFREIANGVVLIDRWRMLLFATELDTVAEVAGQRVRSWFYGTESGGEVARASWPDGITWRGSLGTLQLHATTPDGTPAPRTAIHLAGTDYRTTTDSAGDATVTDLIPGPYTVSTADARLSSIGFEVPSGVTFTAVRDSTTAYRGPLRTAEEYVLDRCTRERAIEPKLSAIVFGRVMFDAGSPARNVKVEVLREVRANVWEPIRRWYRTGGDGTFALCTNEIVRYKPFRLRATREGFPPVELALNPDDYLTIVRVPLGMAR